MGRRIDPVTGLSTLVKNLTGQRFGRLAVLSYAGLSAGPRKRAVWLCMCDCGKETRVLGVLLSSGGTTSCGCYHRERQHEARRTHGEAVGNGSVEYGTWLRMLRRCDLPTEKNYPNYGGRGIRVCEAWKQSFDAFLRDMGRRPSDKHSIDRIDVNGNYEPSNCRWATKAVQASNTRTNVYVEWRGEKLCQAEFARRIGIGIATVRARLAVGWDLERIATTPPNAGRSDSMRAAWVTRRAAAARAAQRDSGGP